MLGTGFSGPWMCLFPGPALGGWPPPFMFSGAWLGVASFGAFAAASLFSYNYLRPLAFFSFLLIFFLVLSNFLYFNKITLWYQGLEEFYRLAFLNLAYVLGLDGLSIFFASLSAFLVACCYLNYWFLRYRLSLYTVLLGVTLLCLVNVFLALDFMIFFIFFEALIIPMFLFIGVWGSRSRKIYAAYQFFAYTFLGSVFLLVAFLSVWFHQGSSAMDALQWRPSFDYRQFFLWLFLFLGFSVKIPLFPFHLWLPEAHVEAPTPASVILAALLLKVGSYAMLRLLLGSFLTVVEDLLFLLLALFLGAFTYASLLAINQVDMKKVIAYASISHMNFAMLGLFSATFLGVSGALLMMVGHTVTSAALFFGIGVLYDRYKSRLLLYYGSLVTFMPFFAVLYFVFILSNFSFPGTANFAGEFLLSTGLFSASNVVLFLGTFAMVLTLVYSLFFYNRVFFGLLQPLYLRYYADSSRLETAIFLPLVLAVIAVGLWPQPLVDFWQVSLGRYSFILW